MFPQRSTYRPLDGTGGLGHGGGHGGGHAHGGGHGGGRARRGGFSRGGSQSFYFDESPDCFCNGIPCPCPDPLQGLGAYYANTFEQPINGLGGCGCAGRAPAVGAAIDTRIRRGGGWDHSLGADDATPAAPSTGMVIATTFGWLMAGGVVGAALWALGEEVLGVHRGRR